MQFLCSAWKWASIVRNATIERLQLLSIHCQTTNDEQKGRQINEQTGQIKKKREKTDLEIICTLTTKLNRKQTTSLQVQTWKLTGWQVQTQKICIEYSTVFTSKGCFKGTFSLQIRDDMKQYQAPSGYTTYALHKPFNNELGETARTPNSATTRGRQNS